MKIQRPSCNKTLAKLDLTDNWVKMEFIIICFKCHISQTLELGDSSNDCFVENNDIMNKNGVRPEDLKIWR